MLKWTMLPKSFGGTNFIVYRDLVSPSLNHFKKLTLICVSRLPHTHISKFHNILNIYYHIKQNIINTLELWVVTNIHRNK